MREKDVERILVTGVRKLGGVAFKFVSPGNDGVPDRLVVMPGGQIWFVELKTDAGRLSPRQVAQTNRLNRLGCRTVVLYGAADVADFLRHLQQEGGEADEVRTP